MKKINLDLIKDLIISILIVISIALVISVIFYDKISLSKVIPESEDYKLTEQMQKDLNETQESEPKEVITTYYIDAADLKKYEKTNEYVKGKQNPFAQESIDLTSNIITNSNLNNGSSFSTNFYEDDGTK